MQKNIVLVLRRFGALVVDLTTWGFIFVILSNFWPTDLNYWDEDVTIFVVVVAFIVLDSLSLAWFRTSPGRWLFGVVLNKTDSGKLNFMAGFESNLIFWLMLGLLSATWPVVIGLVFLTYYFLRHGVYFHEQTVGITVAYPSLGKLRLTIGIIVFLVILGGIWIAVTTSVEPTFETFFTSGQ